MKSLPIEWSEVGERGNNNCSKEIFVSPTLKVTDWSHVLQDITSTVYNRSKALAVLKMVFLKINGTLGGRQSYQLPQIGWKVEVPTLHKNISAMPVGINACNRDPRPGQAIIQNWEDHMGEHTAKLSSKWIIRKISMNYKAKRHDHWVHLTLGLRRLDGLLILPLEVPGVLVTSVVTSPPKVGIEVPSYENTASGGDCFQFTPSVSHGVLGENPNMNHFPRFWLGSNDTDSWLAVVLYGRKTGGPDLVCHRCGAVAGTRESLLSRSRSSNHIFPFSNIGEKKITSEGGSALLTLATMALLRE
ncbi:hypothetical protein Tco_0739807 [Tanacetum coccineum]